MIFWFDCETTGLDMDNDAILEVAALITDDNLNVLDQYEAVLHAGPETLKKMNEWSEKQHGLSGLTEECRNSSITISEVESNLIDLIARNFVEEIPIIAGSSIHFDRDFIKNNFPILHANLHYRHLDVSSFILGINRTKQVKFERKPLVKHRAMPDIKDSLEMFREIMKRFN